MTGTLGNTLFGVRPKVAGIGQSFGTFGELLQGVLPGDLSFLVTLPISLYSYAMFIPKEDSPEVSVFPSTKVKAWRLARAIMDHVRPGCGGILSIRSEIPEAKGMASSSADLVATARSIESAFGIPVELPLLQRLMSEIEPSDGVMYSGIVSFYHREVRLGKFLGSLPSLTIVAGDEGGQIDTLEFNSRPKPFSATEKREYQNLLQSISLAVHTGDLGTIGRVATRSAEMNQKLSLKRTLDFFIQICQEINGLGVVVAHSGTCLGILLDPGHPEYAKQVAVACAKISRLTTSVNVYQTLSFDSKATERMQTEIQVAYD